MRWLRWVWHRITWWLMGADLKDIYAQFGQTFSFGCHLESTLANLILVSDYAKKVLDEARANGHEKSAYEIGRGFDDYLTKQHSKTMGALIGGPNRKPGGVKDFIKLDSALDARVEEALRRRNYLAHNFWQERGGEVMSVKRSTVVLSDLYEDGVFFEKLANELEVLANGKVREMGLDADKLKAAVDDGVKEMQRELGR